MFGLEPDPFRVQPASLEMPTASRTVQQLEEQLRLLLGEDTRRACKEAKNEAMHPFCITIDFEARDCLPRVYVAVNNVLADEIRKLPAKIPDIYRKITA